MVTPVDSRHGGFGRERGAECLLEHNRKVLGAFFNLARTSGTGQVPGPYNAVSRGASGAPNSPGSHDCRDHRWRACTRC